MQSQIQNDIKTADNIGRQFLQAFFTPNTDIANFYGNDSILTFETEVYVGRDEIIGKLKNLQVYFTSKHAKVRKVIYTFPFVLLFTKSMFSNSYSHWS